MPRKKNQAFGLGKALINDRFGKKKNLQQQHLHARDMEIIEGQNLQSITEMTDMEDFLATAEMAGTEFTAERVKYGLQIVNNHKVGLISRERDDHVTQLNVDSMLSVPRRPKWDYVTTSKEKLEFDERESFLDWRRHLASVQQQNDIELTPYEKNLDFWRQLWRVIEFSDVIVQIVDARDPLLYRCKDLEKYVKEIDSGKFNILLINKADFLSNEQRSIWKKYWNEQNVTCVFWSALTEAEKLEEQEKEEKRKQDEEENLKEEIAKCKLDENDESGKDLANSEIFGNVATESNEDKSGVENFEQKSVTNKEDKVETEKDKDIKCLTRDELISYLKTFKKDGDEFVKVGMVGYPNVGKSSTVNTLKGEKRVAVSATPGRTKHYQTINIDQQLRLYDCPGLVFPSYVANKAEMVLSGILPIDQMRDYVAPCNLLASRIKPQLLNAFYGIRIKQQQPTAEQLLEPHALSRGFMTSHGQPDASRSARLVLKDYVNGKLVYSKAPPGVEIDVYQETTPMLSQLIVDSKKFRSTQQMMIANKKNDLENVDVDDNEREIQFFQVGSTRPNNSRQKGDKKKHFNKKKDKMRRMRTVQY